MKPVHIIAAKRSPIGRFGGGLKTLHPAELATLTAASVVLEALRQHVGQVILGQVLQAASGMNVARQVGLKLGLPEHVPAFTVNMVCGSSLKAIALGSDAIRSGESDIVLAGGVEVMSRAPHYATETRWGKKLGDVSLQDSILVDGLSDPLTKMAMGETAERIADKFGITRHDQDVFAERSQSRFAANREAVTREIVPVSGVNADEHPRSDTTVATLAPLKPSFRKDGTVIAGNSSGINDGAACVLLASDHALHEHKLISRARIVGTVVVGCDPSLMGLGPVGAIQKLCVQTGWKLADVEAIEINEAFAAQTLGCMRELSIDINQLNQRGGAIALGHPIGASGARVLVTLLHLMEDCSYRRGIASLCIGGGMGIAMAIERDV